MAPHDFDLIIVGMGSGGMVAAEFAATLGVKVLVVERDRVGGDCLWTGCVPSKALLASAKAAHTFRHADKYGLEPVEPVIDTAKVLARIRAVQQELAASDDSAERFEAQGVVFRYGEATLTGPNAVSVGGEEISGRFVLLCTGSRPSVPPIDGLTEAGFLTSETVWDLERAPASLTFIGAGPIALEMAQAFTRLGVRVTALDQADRILVRDEPSLSERLLGLLRGEGVDIRLGVSIQRVTVEGAEKIVHLEGGERVAAHEIFVGAGRQPNVEGLGLEALGIEVTGRGVSTDDRMRTSVRSIYAAGDLAGRFLFTHSAGFEAARAVRNMFFPGSSSGPFMVPWATFTDPELAHAGMTEAEAREEHGDEDVRVWRQELAHSDRARADSAGEGAIVIVTAKGRVVGAHALAPGAGELIHELALVIHQGLKLTELADLVHVYPTLSIGIQQLAGEASFEGAQKFRWLVRSSA
jgi:pyruvate/2-oxoglutarate dehydrogenase complex dihydrolipoamide dehydrogenase (E3) component